MREGTKRRHMPVAQIILLVLLPLAAYVGVQLYRATSSTYAYENAVAYTMSDSIEAQGLVLFDEANVEGGGDLGYLVSDGERVSSGTQVAEVYTDPAQAGVRSQWENLESQIELLQKSQNTSSNQVSVLISERSTAVYDLLESIDRSGYLDVPGEQQDYLLAQNKLQVTTGEASSFSDLISQLTAQRDTLSGQLSGLASITAPGSGYFVSSRTAKNLTVAKADALNLSAVDLQQLLQTGAETDMSGLAGKIIASYTWQFVGVCTLDESAKFDGKTTVQLSFPGKAETKLPATVVSVEKDEQNGIAKFVLQCEYVGTDILKLSQETAQIDFASYNGLRISSSAVHLVWQEPSASSTAASSASSQAGSAASVPSSAAASSASDGTSHLLDAIASSPAQGGEYVAGVYVKYGNLARFRRITVLYEDKASGYILVPLNGAMGTGDEVRMYDEVIVSGSDLYDGKLL